MDEDIVRAFMKILEFTYDGDQISVKMLFSQEANEEAKRRIHSKIQLVDTSGTNFRTTTNELAQGLYELTIRR